MLKLNYKYSLKFHFQFQYFVYSLNIRNKYILSPQSSYLAYVSIDYIDFSKTSRVKENEKSINMKCTHPFIYRQRFEIFHAK